MQKAINIAVISQSVLKLQNRSIKEFGLTVIVLFNLFLLFYWKLLFGIHGFLSFGNFSQILNLTEANQFFPFYNPNSDFGSIVSFPLGFMENYALGMSIISFPSKILGLPLGTKIYIFLASIIFGLCFYYFASIFTYDYLARLVSALFFLFNPFTIQLYASGDFSLLIFQSFILVGAVFLYKAVIKGNFVNPFYILSAFFMVLSFVSFQVFLTGLILYFIILVYTILFSSKWEGFRRKGNYMLESIFAFSLPAIFLGLIVIIPTLFGPTSYLPGSVSSLPLSTFVDGSLSFFKVLTLEAYPPPLSWISVLNSFGSFFYSIWYWLEIILIAVLLLVYFFLRDKRLLFFSVAIAIVSLFASETKGPISSLTIYLYEHFTGYQALNYPYIWVWFLIMPFYAIVVAIIFSDLSSRHSYSSKNKHKIIFGINKENKNFKMIFLSKNTRKILRHSFFGLMILVLVSPIITQGYYGTNGIRQVNMPSWFNRLNNDLVNFTQTNHSGVVFNTINAYFQFGNNSSDGLGNLLQENSPYGSVALSSYIPNYNTITNFYYWFYYILYNNQTEYSAQILSSFGIQYFVDIFNANSEGYPYFVPWSYNVNASNILLHQLGWDRIVQTQNFSIFKDEYYNSNTYYTNNLSLILGNYNTLNDMAYLGINLQNVTPIFQSDIVDNNNMQQIFNHIGLVVMSGYNSIYNLILSTANSTLIYPVNYVDGEQSDVSRAWINSERLNNYPFYGSLIPFAETSGNNTLNVPITVQESGPYYLFLKLALDNSSIKGGLLNILVNGKSVKSLNTSTVYENETNSFIWVKINTTLPKGKNILSLHSEYGFNAVSEISVLNNTELKRATAFTNDFLFKERNNILQIYQPQKVVPSNRTGYYHGSGLGDKFPNGNYLYLNGLHGDNSVPIDSPVSVNGTFFAEILSDAYFTFNITYGNVSTELGAEPGIYVPISSASSGTMLLPVKNFKSANIDIIQGDAFVGIMALLPNKYRFSELPIVYSTMGNITYEGIQAGITNFIISEKKDSNYTVISGSFTYQNVSDYFPVSLSFSANYPYNSSIIFLSNVNGPATLDINGITVESTDFCGDPLVSPTLNDQYHERPSNFNLNFVPNHFNSNVSYNVSFVIRFIGYSNFPRIFVLYSPTIESGPNISYTISGYNIKNPMNGILILRVPFYSGLESNIKLNSAGNGLMTLITQNGGKMIHVYTEVYRFFMVAVYIAIAFSVTYFGVSLFLRKRNKKVK